MAFRVILFCVLLLSYTPLGHAQDRVKQLLFDDCDAAQAEFSKLDSDQQRALSDFLARVVGLNTQSPSAPEAFAMIPGSQRPGDSSLLTSPKGADLIPGSLWQNMDAKRELRGKRCALDLFQIAGASSLDAIPALVQTYSEQPLSDEIAVGVEETVALIAERAHKQGLNPSQQQVELILPHLVSPRPLVAQNVVQEYLVLVAPHLIRFMADRPQSDASPLSAYLRTVDPDGARSMRTFLDLVPTLSKPQIETLAATLPLPAKEVLGQFVPDLVRLAATSSYIGTFSTMLGASCLKLGSLRLDNSTEAQLVQIAEIVSPGAIEEPAARCLVASSPALARRLPSLLGPTRSSSQQAVAVMLLDNAHKFLSAEQRLQVYTRLKEIAVSSTGDLATASMQALALFPESRTDSFSVAYQTLKRAFEVKDTVVKESLVRSSFNLLSALKLGKESTRFAPFIIRALQNNIARDSAITLSTQAPQIESELVGLLSAPHNHTVQGAALEALAARSSISKKAIQPILNLLRDQDFQPRAEEILTRIGSAATPVIRRMLPRASDEVQTSLLSTLVLLGSATKTEVSELTTALASTNCSLLAQRSRVLCQLDAVHRSSTGDPNALRATLNRCLPSFTAETFNSLLACMPQTVVGAAEGTSTFFADSANADSAQQLLEILFAPSTAPLDRDGLMTAFLAKSSPIVQEKLLAHVHGGGVISPSARAAIRDAANAAEKDSPLYFSALRALAATADTEFDWHGFLKKAIETVGHGEHSAEVRAIIALLPTEVVLADVVPALEQDNPDRLVGACMIGASLGSRAIPIVSKIWHLREKRSPAVRYAAILALLEINPLTPDISDYVRRILVNRYFPLATTLPITWNQTAAVVELNRSTFGTLRTVRLEQLLSTRR